MFKPNLSSKKNAPPPNRNRALISNYQRSATTKALIRQRAPIVSTNPFTIPPLYFFEQEL